MAAPVTPLQVPAIVVVGNIKAAEKEIRKKDMELHYTMRSFDPFMINEANLNRYDEKMQEFEVMAKDLALSMEYLCLGHAALVQQKLKNLKIAGSLLKMR